MVRKSVVKRTAKEQKDTAEILRAIKALQGTQHNPIDFGAILTFIAPIVARMAVRYAVRVAYRKLNRKLTTKVSEEMVDTVSERVGDIIQQSVIKRLKKL